MGPAWHDYPTSCLEVTPKPVAWCHGRPIVGPVFREVVCDVQGLASGEVPCPLRDSCNRPWSENKHEKILASGPGPADPRLDQTPPWHRIGFLETTGRTDRQTSSLTEGTAPLIILSMVLTNNGRHDSKSMVTAAAAVLYFTGKERAGTRPISG